MKGILSLVTICALCLITFTVVENHESTNYKEEISQLTTQNESLLQMSGDRDKYKHALAEIRVYLDGAEAVVGVLPDVLVPVKNSVDEVLEREEEVEKETADADTEEETEGTPEEGGP